MPSMSCCKSFPQPPLLLRLLLIPALAACTAAAQQPPPPSQQPAPPAADSAASQQTSPPAPVTPQTPVPPPDTPVPQPSASLTLAARLRLETHSAFGVSGFVLPAGDAAVDMARPPARYPREWRDGGQAFARNYGAEYARHTVASFTHFAVAALDREDPRYYPSLSHNVFGRTAHALAFTLVDRSVSGSRALAVSNLAGSMAAGAVGMAFYPDGFNDFTHAYQRGSVEITSFATHNLIAEFSPEIVHVLHKLHVSDRAAEAILPVESAGVTHHAKSQP